MISKRRLAGQTSAGVMYTDPANSSALRTGSI
jgi:hypothetical protein